MVIHGPFQRQSYILKQTWWCLFVSSDKQGRAGQGQGGQGSRCGGPGEVPFLLKKSLGKTRGPASNQTKIQIKKKIIFVIEHIKKIRIFLKKKIENK
jgi:hypothetical protein